jgi:hypothetical protein
MKIVITVLLFCVTAMAQTSSDLRQRFGTPASETFLVRQGIVVTVTYAKNGKPTELLIEPQRPETPIKSSTARLSLEVLNEIIDELAPLKERGKPLFAGFVNARCLPNNDCWGTQTDYEKVFIYYNASGKNEYRYATVQWKSEDSQK